MTQFATYPSLIDRTVLITGGATGIGASLVEHFAGQGAKVGFIDDSRSFRKREPAPLALRLFFPTVQFLIDRQGEHIDIDHQRCSVPPALAIAIRSQRDGADQSANPGLFFRFLRGGGMRHHAGRLVALGDDPALVLPRRHEETLDRRIDGGPVGAVR